MTKAIQQHMGQQAETWVLTYLQKKGLQLVTRNFRCHRGEIDLILKDKEDLVFVEVRYRQHKNYGTSIETIDGIKQRKIIQSAEYYLYSQKLWEHPCRFDVVGVTHNLADKVEIVWEKNAFDNSFYI